MAPVPIRLMITDLPYEIMMNILKRLSPKELLRCLCVLKSWKCLISSKYFYKVHLQWSLETNAHRKLVVAKEWDGRDPTEFFTCAFYDRDVFSSARRITQPLRSCGGQTVIVGCCNGLICMFSTDDYQWLGIWNPCIQKFKPIPPTPYEIPEDAKGTDGTNYGFGYFEDDYKVVRILQFEVKRDVTVYGSEVKVYSLQSNSWKKIEGFSCKWSTRAPIPLEGALHWFGQLEPPSRGLRVLALDFKNEMFKEFPTPFEVELDKSLEVLNGKLCIGDFHDSDQINIWEMKDYGLEPWTHLYTIVKEIARWTFKSCTPITSSRTGNRILFHGFSDSTSWKLFWYDSEKDTSKPVAIPGMPKKIGAAICVANLGLLDGVSVINRAEGYKQFEMSEGEGSGHGEMSEGEWSEEGEMREGEWSEEGEMSEGEWSEEGEMSQGKRVRTK